MTYFIVGIALVAALFLFIEARLKAARTAAAVADAERRGASRRRRSPVRRGRAELRLLPSPHREERRRAHG